MPRVIIFHARSYDFVGQDGRAVAGNNVAYLEEMPPMREATESGLLPMSVTADGPVLEALVKSELPALVDVEFGRRPGRRGRPESVLTKAAFVQAVPIASILGKTAK
jgi:hypothetical protein